MDPYKVLFVCWGNICRSPAAECVFTKQIVEQGLDHQLACDSAGTMGLHAGHSPDTRMREAAARRSIPFFGESRKIRSTDFAEFDLILAMDRQNLSDLEAFRPQGPTRARVHLFGHFLNPEHPPEVPDPYYGGGRGFEQVLDMVEKGCQNLIEHIKSR